MVTTGAARTANLAPRQHPPPACSNDSSRRAAADVDPRDNNISQNQSYNNKKYSSSSISSSSSSNNNALLLQTTSNMDQSKYIRPGRPKHAAQKELYHGIILYLTAIFLPSLPRYMYQLYLWSTQSTYCRVLHERILWCVWVLWKISMYLLWKVRIWIMGISWRILWSGRISSSFSSSSSETVLSSSSTTQSIPLSSKFSSSTISLGSSSRSGMMARRLGRRIRKYIFSTSTASLWEEFNRQQQQQQQIHITAAAASARSNSIHQRYLFVPPSIRIMVVQDMQLLILLSIVLAIVRVWFVHILVPEYLVEVKQLEALTRCKSSHLLSNSSHNLLSLGGGGGGGGGGLSNCSGGGGGGVGGGSTTEDQQTPRLGGSYGRSVGEDGGWRDRISAWALSHFYRLRPSINRALGHEPSVARYDAIIVQQEQQSQQERQHQHDQHQHPPSLLRRASNSTPTQQLFFAPRHATATFRLLFTSLSCFSALFLFQNAEFWPRAVFGTHPNASTRHCWDLSGSFSALGLLDDDYDAKNGALKYFFLAQAAYQLHSLCFHFVSMLLLLFYGGSGGGGGVHFTNLTKVFSGRFRGRRSKRSHQKTRSRRLLSMKTSMQSYFRPMTEHVIVLAILIGAYLFSGMRRLCAVGIFTLEMSSVFLQLLQVCIYAPETSWLRKPRLVFFVHRLLTVPTFVYCRLIVLPFILWRSALFESHEWLEQIEKVFSPRWAERLYALFNGSLCLIFALNLVLFQRLLFILKNK